MSAKKKSASNTVSVKKTTPKFEPKLAMLSGRVERLEQELERERRRYDQLLEIVIHIVRERSAVAHSADELLRMQPELEGFNLEAAAPLGGAAPATARLGRTRVERKVVSVVMILASPKPANPNSSFDDSDLDWDGQKKRTAFVPIDRLMRDDGVRISGIGPADFESLENVPEMVNLVFNNQAPLD